MDLAHDRNSIDRAHSASTTLSSQVVRELLASAETPRDVLVAALQESTRQIESLLSCVSGTFYRGELSPPWRMEFFSPGIEAISGYGPEHFAGEPFGDIIDAEDLEPLESLINEAIARREHFSACYRIHHKSGELRWVSERGAAVYDEAGQPQFLEGFIADVTASKLLEIEADKARSEVDEVNRQMRRVLECTLEGIASYDRDWNCRFLNAAARQELGEQGDPIGRNVHELHPLLKQSTMWPLLQRAMIDREAGRGESGSETSRAFDVYAVPDKDGVSVYFRNISDRKRLESALVKQAEELRNTLDTIPNMVWTTLPDASVDYYNKSWNEFVFGNADPVDDGGGKLRADKIHRSDFPNAQRRWMHSLATGEPFETELRMLHHSGEYRWLLARGWPQRDESGEIVKWCGAVVDIHERVMAERHLRESKNLQTNLLDASSDCIEITDLDGNLVFLNTAALATRGETDSNAALGTKWAEHSGEESRPAGYRAFRQAKRGEVGRIVECAPNIKGETVWWDLIVSPIRNTEGEITNILSIARDITEQKQVSERLRVASEQDSLTGLANRRAFHKHLKTATRRARAAGGNVGLMLLDLDHFKHVNDTLGHLAGDHLLRVIARRLEACVRDFGFVARLGGDEFAIVLSDIHEEKELVSAAAQVLTRMEAPVTFAGKMINGGLSIGCAMYPRDAKDARTLLQHTDTALYDLKASGRGGIQMFNTRMMEAAERTAGQLALARTAIRDDAVEPYYQPKVRLNTGEISGFEALLRWWSPGHGIQPPSSVAEAFNDYELSTKIGGLMQGRVLADMAGWLQHGLDLPPISINAAPAEFLRDDYAEHLLERLRQHAIPPHLIEIEITEHAFLERRSEQVIRALEMLKQAGARIALDDFGTGHSSLSHLRDFPVDVLKIDRSFVSRMLSKPRMLAIVQAITKLGPSLSLDIVAEGVETPEQLHALRDAGCEFGQGYLFGKAMNAGEVGKRLATANWPFKLREPAQS